MQKHSEGGIQLIHMMSVFTLENQSVCAIMVRE
jgi:hypothetical protein